jgi:hypothetical protein
MTPLSNTGWPTPDADDAGSVYKAALAAFFAGLDASAAVGPLSVKATTGLGVAVAAGVMAKADDTLFTYAGGTLTLGASATTHLWLTDAGVLASGASWPAAVAYVPLATVVTSGSAVTSVTDARVVFRSVQG